MKHMVKWMLGAAIAAGGLAVGTTTAHAAQIGVYVSGGPAAYVPPAPGPGYQWIAGYYSGGYWVPGQWAFVGSGYYNGDDYRYRAYDGDQYGYRAYDGDGDRWRNRDRGWGREGDRHWDNGRGWGREGYRGGDHRDRH